MKSLGIAIILLFISLANAKVCEAYFHGELQFAFTDPRDQRAESIELGEGTAGKVFLKYDAIKAEFTVLKKYLFSPMEEGSQFKNDLRAFDVLRNLNSLPFELPSYQKVGIDYMKLSYHPGRNIEDLFHDKKLSPSVKSQIEKKYLKTLGDMIRILEGEGFIVSVKRGPLPRIAFQKGVTQIILKPDNFIVNPETLDFTLIDPT